jgi:hypothetical protein
MTKIALAGINSFALGPTGHVLAGRICFALHALAERVAIFGEETSNFNAAIENVL